MDVDGGVKLLVSAFFFRCENAFAQVAANPGLIFPRPGSSALGAPDHMAHGEESCRRDSGREVVGGTCPGPHPIRHKCCDSGLHGPSVASRSTEPRSRLETPIESAAGPGERIRHRKRAASIMKIPRYIFSLLRNSGSSLLYIDCTQMPTQFKVVLFSRWSSTMPLARGDDDYMCDTLLGSRVYGERSALTPISRGM